MNLNIKLTIHLAFFLIHLCILGLNIVDNFANEIFSKPVISRRIDVIVEDIYTKYILKSIIFMMKQDIGIF